MMLTTPKWGSTIVRARLPSWGKKEKKNEERVQQPRSQSQNRGGFLFGKKVESPEILLPLLFSKKEVFSDDIRSKMTMSEIVDLFDPQKTHMHARTRSLVLL